MVPATGRRPGTGKLVTAQKRRATDYTAARLVNYFIYVLYPETGNKKWPEAYNYHPFYNSILFSILLLIHYFRP